MVIRLTRLLVVSMLLAGSLVSALPADAATGWVQATTQNPGSSSNVFYGVNCVSSTFCVAVGAQVGASGFDQTLIEDTTDGSGSNWTVMPSPNPAGASAYNDLYSVSCLTPSFCVAAGSDTSSSGVQLPLAEIYNGSLWVDSSTQTPPGSQNAIFNSITCISPSSCVAVGTYADSSGNYNTLIESYSGSGWQIDPSPNPAVGGQNTLWGISCAGTSYCMTAGGGMGSSAYQNIALESFDGGQSWNSTSSAPIEVGPNGGITTNNDFDGVTCLGESNCLVSGFYENSSNISQAIVEIYSGSWALGSVQNPSSSDGQVFPWSIGCESSNLCFLVGGYQSGSAEENLIEESTNQGSTWSAQTNVNSSTYNFLYGISCAVSGYCIAVGSGSTTAFAESYATPTTCNTSSNNLSNQNLSGCNLAGGDLQGKNLKGSNLANANLSGANIQGSNLLGVDLSGSDLSGAILKGSNLANANLSGANLSAAQLQGANLKGVNFSNAILTGALLTGANLIGITWSNTTCPDGTNSNNDGGTCINNL